MIFSIPLLENAGIPIINIISIRLKKAIQPGGFFIFPVPAH